MTTNPNNEKSCEFCKSPDLTSHSQSEIIKFSRCNVHVEILHTHDLATTCILQDIKFMARWQGGQYRSRALPWTPCWNPCTLSLRTPARHNSNVCNFTVNTHRQVHTPWVIRLTCTTRSCSPAVMNSSSVSTLRMKLALIGLGRSCGMNKKTPNKHDSEGHSGKHSVQYGFITVLSNYRPNCLFCQKFRRKSSSSSSRPFQIITASVKSSSLVLKRIVALKLLC